jgi:photosystem II stability/assembly factor-like uncharacterized protein
LSGDFSICIGTIGSGIWHSSNSGGGWRRSRMRLPFHAEPGEIQVRALAVSPHQEHQLYAGSEVGLHRSDDGGASWELVESPMQGSQIWSLALHPQRPGVVLAGTKPPALYRSEDGGAHWDRLPIATARECFAGPPKITQIVFDPRDPDTIWVGVEVDGVHRSRDGGKTWERLPPLGGDPTHQDIHGLSVAPGPQPTIRATTPDGLWSSTDEGRTWELFRFPRFFERSGISYCRGHALKPGDPDVIFVGNGDFIPGKIGAIQQTRDGGKTWAAASLPRTPNATIYSFATHPADPDVVAAHSLFGYVYTSTDSGQTWRMIEREFGEIRSIAWLPS